MIDVEFATASFKDNGAILCPECQRRIQFPNGCAVIELTLVGVRQVLDARTRELLHDCRRRIRLFCSECGYDCKQVVVGHRAPVCLRCGTTMEERVVWDQPH